MTEVVRIFVSSPGDVGYERARAERVTERLSGIFDGVRIETYRWEAGRYFSAHDGFQPQIPNVAGFDIVVGLFWSRVGSALPPGFQRMADGRAYPSGTAFEVLTAIELRKSGAALPDVFVYRKMAATPVPPDDEAAQRARIDELGGLNAFMGEWFVNPKDGFKAAFTPFATADEFERLFEDHLRAWLRDNRRLGRERRWRVEESGSPFRGLEPFAPSHREVFFGRRADVERARERLEAAATRGCGFLLIEGASGTGKSSLALAGLLPRLTDLDLDLRVARLRPGDGALPLTALAEALFAAGAAPELAAGDFPAPADLVAHLAAGGGIQPVVRALDRAGAALGAAEGRDVAPAIGLVLLADQLEELFAQEVAPDARRAFAETLAALARAGRVQVVATLRADARGAALAEPALAGLIDAGAALALAPPGPEALAEIVRGPATAAGLGFERRDGVGLDEALIAEADAEALPLLQFTLEELYARAVARVKAAGRVLGDVAADEPVAVLTFADHAALGGIAGAVSRQAEAAFAALPPAAQAALPRLVRALTDAGGAAGAVLRAVPIEEAAPDAPGKALAEALAAARILVRDGETLRFAHEQALSA